MLKDKNRFKLKIAIAVIVVIVSIIAPIIAKPYVEIEKRTDKYGKQFEDGYKQTGMIDEIEYYKVFEYSGDKAKIYYVSENYESGDYIWFKKSGSEWKMERWETVWAKRGSADGFTNPYYPRWSFKSIFS